MSIIKSFKDKEAEKLFNREYSLKLPFEIQERAKNHLRIIHRCENIHDLKLPFSNHLEKLKADRIGQYSIRINQQWRICFNWENNNAYNVEITDYH